MVNVTKKKTGRNRGSVVSALDKQIGENIRVLRQCNAMNQLALASKINVNAQQLSKYEKGENRISASNLLTIAGVLGVDITAMYRESVINYKNNEEQWWLKIAGMFTENRGINSATERALQINKEHISFRITKRFSGYQKDQ